MLEFFRNIGQRKNDNADQKGDKAFIIILIVFGVIIAVSYVAGISGKSEKIFDLKFSLFDSVILGGIFIGYLISRLKGKG